MHVQLKTFQSLIWKSELLMFCNGLSVHIFLIYVILYIYTLYTYIAIYVILDRIIIDDLMITDNRESEQYVQTTSFLEALELVTGFKGWFSHSLVALKSLHFLMSGVICIRFLNIFSAC